MTRGTGRAPRWGARVVVATVAVSGLSILVGQARAGVKEGPAFVGDDRRPPAAVEEARWLVRTEKAIAAAESQIGVPYVYAAARPGHGFDCSGLVMWAWSHAGVRLPHNSTD